MNGFEKADNAKFKGSSMPSFAKLFLCCLFLSLHVVQSENKMTPKDFAADCLAAHNNYRAKHGVEPLTLNAEISTFSQSLADKLSSSGALVHSGGMYGENLYMASSTAPGFEVACKDAVDDWYDEIKMYKFGREPATNNAGHFTQVIWKASKEMGVAYADNGAGSIVVVANYLPPGNLIGAYTENVPPVDPSKAGAANILTPVETYFGTSSPSAIKIICAILNTVFIFLVNMLYRV